LKIWVGIFAVAHPTLFLFYLCTRDHSPLIPISFFNRSPSVLPPPPSGGLAGKLVYFFL
jgi:hypothetical protein